MKTGNQLRMLAGSGPGAVTISCFALILVQLVPPMFMMGIGTRYYAGAGGAGVGLLSGVISAWAFTASPKRAFPKTVTFLLLLPTLYFAFQYTSAFLVFGPRG